MGNYDGGLVNTGFLFEGYLDNYNCSSKEFDLDGGDNIIANRKYKRYSESGKKIYEFALIPNINLDGENEPMCLVAWIIFESAFTIDNFLQIDKINL